MCQTFFFPQWFPSRNSQHVHREKTRTSLFSRLIEKSIGVWESNIVPSRWQLRLLSFLVPGDLAIWETKCRILYFVVLDSTIHRYVTNSPFAQLPVNRRHSKATHPEIATFIKSQAYILKVWYCSTLPLGGMHCIGKTTERHNREILSNEGWKLWSWWSWQPTGNLTHTRF